MKHILITTIAAVVLVGCGERPPRDIWEATKSGNIESVKQYLDAGAIVNAKDKDGWIALHYAALEGHKDIVELLIDKGADINAMDWDGFTPMINAALEGHKEIVELIIEKGAVINTRDRLGSTPLDTILRFNNSEIVNLLRKHGGKTGVELSIHVAVRKRNIEAVKQHIAAGADVNAKDNGIIPLNLATGGGHMEFV